MRGYVFLVILLLTACGSQSESELRRTPWERGDYTFPGEPEAVSNSIFLAAKRCFDGKRINLLRTFVHKEPHPDGDGFIITAFQLGTFDAAILIQMEIKPAPQGSRVALFRSASMLVNERVGPFVERWVKGETACPSVL
ncbi:MAG: hypothetical protein H7Z12_00010 [Rhodospirillaceae bacterium]|nr:hypothetical protein [Rhodospirillales bacterium]